MFDLIKCERQISYTPLTKNNNPIICCSNNKNILKKAENLGLDTFKIPEMTLNNTQQLNKAKIYKVDDLEIFRVYKENAKLQYKKIKTKIIDKLETSISNPETNYKNKLMFENMKNIVEEINNNTSTNNKTY